MISSVVSVADEPLERALALAERHPDAMLAVVGPTASGKTALAVPLAERLNGEVVSCDSVQIYRFFDIGSGKPSAAELARVPHHMIGAIDPLDAIDAAKYAEMAERVVAGVRARGKRPIVCGGTFLWLKALVFGLAEAPAASATSRAKHREIAEREGRPALHARLREVDPAGAARLHPNDFVRVSRALEVFELTGKPMSAWHEEHAFARSRHEAKLVGLRCSPDELTKRIETRVRGFVAAGWVDEARDLVARGFGDARAMTSVGYREVRAHLAGEISEADLVPAIVRATRVFARRQRTWLKHADVTWL
jgi:tRNA dimethylallyltransferase